MPKMKKCPVCGQPIKLENLEKHVKKVHPRESVEIEYTEKEEKTLKAQRKKEKELTKPAGLWKIATVVLIIIVAIAAVVTFWPTPNPDRYSDFTVTDTTGNTITLSAWEGEVILLDFMQSNCGHCANNVQTALRPIFNNYSNQIKMLSVSIRDADTNQDLITFKDTYGAQWPYALDTAGARDMYYVKGTPTDFVIDRDGYIIYSHIGLDTYADLSTAIDKAL